MTGERSHPYLLLTAGLSPAAVGVHAHAAAYAAVWATGGLVPRAELAARGMDDGLERELLEAGLLRQAGGDLLTVAVEPFTETAAKELARVERERRRSEARRRGKKPASSGQTTAVAAVAAVEPQIAGPTAAASPPASSSRVRAHGAGASPLLNVLEGRTASNSAAGAREPGLVGELRELLAAAFCRPGDDLSDEAITAGITAARSYGRDPVELAREAVAMGVRATWRTRHAGDTMAIAARAPRPPAATPAARRDPEAERQARQARRRAIAAGEIPDPSPFAAEAS